MGEEEDINKKVDIIERQLDEYNALHYKAEKKAGEEEKSKLHDEMKELSQILINGCAWCGDEIGDNLVTCNKCSELHTLKESKEKFNQELKRLNRMEEEEDEAKEILMKELGIEIATLGIKGGEEKKFPK